MTPLDHFIHRKVVVLHSDVPVSQAARAMCNREVGCIIASDSKGSIAGILTDRDVVYALVCEGADLNAPLSEIMTVDPITIPETASLEDAIHMMVENGVRRLPVTRTHDTGGAERKCAGVVTLDDLIANQAIDVKSISKIVKAQMFGRATSSASFHNAQHEPRSEARREQTLNHFHNQVAEETKLFRAAAPQITLFVLGSLVQRLQYSGAAHFIAQLPADLHEDLLDLPAGPNRSISADSILRGVMSRCQTDMATAKEVLSGFFRVLRGMIGDIGMEHLEMQLPEDIRSFFPNQEQAQKRAGGSVDPVLFETRH